MKKQIKKIATGTLILFAGIVLNIGKKKDKIVYWFPIPELPKE